MFCNFWMTLFRERKNGLAQVSVELLNESESDQIWIKQNKLTVAMYVQALDDRLVPKFGQDQIYWHKFERPHVG